MAAGDPEHPVLPWIKLGYSIHDEEPRSTAPIRPKAPPSRPPTEVQRRLAEEEMDRRRRARDPGEASSRDRRAELRSRSLSRHRTDRGARHVRLEPRRDSRSPDPDRRERGDDRRPPMRRGRWDHGDRRAGGLDSPSGSEGPGIQTCEAVCEPRTERRAGRSVKGPEYAEELKSEAERYVMASLARGTRVTYAYGWKEWLMYCRIRHRSPHLTGSTQQ